MPKYTLKYFNAKGRGEVCRMIFALAEIEYEDHRYKSSEWWKSIKESKHKLGVTFPRQIQVLEKLFRTKSDFQAIPCIQNYLGSENSENFLKGIVFCRHSEGKCFPLQGEMKYFSCFSLLSSCTMFEVSNIGN